MDSLLSFHREEAAESQSAVSASSEFLNGIISLKLDPSEVSALMTGIGNMLVKLKTQLCEIVLNWNSKYVIIPSFVLLFAEISASMHNNSEFVAIVEIVWLYSLQIIALNLVCQFCY